MTNKTEKTLETERLMLRHWRTEDAPRLYELAKEPSIGEAARWPPHTSVEMSREVIETVFNDENVFAVVLKESGEIIGCVGANYDVACPMATDERLLGFWLGVGYQGKGYMTEAARRLLEDCFACGVKGVWCDNFPDNLASAAVQHKLGFRFHSIARDFLWGMPDEGRDVTINYLSRKDFGLK